MTLSITLLGPPRITRGGDVVVFETRKATALLAHLAVTARPRSREALCELLYPGQPADRARGALRRTLSNLRQGTGEQWLDTAGDSIALRRDPGLSVDVDRFRTLAVDGAAAEQLGEAVTVYAGSFMEGFGLRDSPVFDDWQASVAATLERELAGALRHLVDDLVTRGEIEQALTHAVRRLELDPLSETAHRVLIRLHAWNGDRAAALEQYRTCVRTLSRELGVAPLDETAELATQVSEGSLPGPVTSAAPPVRPRRRPRVAVGGEPALTGRDRERAVLVEAHAGARPDGGLAIIEGEAGIGKTRLADEVLGQARGEGAIVLAARCHEDESGLPYAPVVTLLREAARGHRAGGWGQAVAPHHLDDAALLVPELAGLGGHGGRPRRFDGPGAQVRLLEGIAGVVTAACAGPVPGLVVVDDVHLADTATVDALCYLGRRLAGRSLLLVLCWRSEAVPPGHRLRRLCADLEDTGRATTVTPARLSEREVEAMVGGTASPDQRRRAFRLTEGLPVFVVEYLAGLHDGVERADDVLSLRTRGLLDSRLTGLDDIAHQVLGAAAAVGRSFDLETLRSAGGRSAEEVVDALEQLVARGIVREVGGDAPGYDFTHEQLRALVYERTGHARRRLLHSRVAATLLARRQGGAGAALVAHHLRLAADDVGAAAQHRAAAEHALSVHAHADALEHLQLALALGPPEAAAVHERLGDVQTLTGDYASALVSHETAAALTTGAAIAPIEQKLGGVHHRRGSWDQAESHLQAALAAAPREAAGLRARIHADLSLTLQRAGAHPEAARLAREALRLAEVADDRQAEAQAHNMLGVLARSSGRLPEATASLTRSLELAIALDDVPAQTAALNNLALVERDAGAISHALELTERALTLCARHRDRHREAALENNLADLHHAAGDEDAAIVHLRRAVTIFSEVGADDATRLPEIWKLVSW